MKLFLLLITLLFSTQIFGQDYRYRLEGTYSISPELSPAPVNFVLQWNEITGSIKGIYRDDYFRTPSNVEGVVSANGRTFNIVFNGIINGAQNLTLLTSQALPVNGSIPLSLTIRNANGETILVTNTAGIMSSINPSNGSDGSLCSVGFGALTGFCGLYAGSVSEAQDTANRCDLIGDGSFRLELATDKSLNIYLRFKNSLEGLPVHKLGVIPLEQLGLNINQNARNCGSLSGTSFFSGHCQRMNLTGSFNPGQGFSHSFSGTYTITDETTAETCSLNLTLERAIAY